MKLFLIVILGLSSTAFAEHEFQYFKLTDQFKRKRALNKGKQDMSPIVDLVLEVAKSEGLRQVNKITQDIIDFNDEFSLGQFNNPDVNWDSGFGGEYAIKIGRSVKPLFVGGDLEEKWIVKDIIEISLEAGLFLKRLRDAGDIDISKEYLDLFAGIKFNRKYTYNHMADSYKEGLLADYNKLIFSFKYFSGLNFLQIDEGDVVSKNDYLSANVELSAYTPSIYFMSGYGKGSIYYSKLSDLTYQRPFMDNRSGERDSLRISYQVSKIKGADLQIGLQADFYKLLTLTLLGAEYQVDYTQTTATNLTFSDEDIERIKNDFQLQLGIDQINRGKNPRKIEAVKPYVTSTEKGLRISEELSMFALIWGKYVGNSTEELEFNTEEGTKYFFRHSEERTKLVKSWWDGVFNADNVSKYNSREIENMAFEFEAIDSDSSFEDIELTFPANLSFRLSKEFKTKKSNKKYTNKAINLMKDFTSLDASIIKGLSEGVVKSPLLLDLNVLVGSNGVEFMLQSDEWDLASSFEKVCFGRIIGDADISSSVKKCLQKLNDYYVILEHDYISENKVNLHNLKDFLQVVSKYTRSVNVLKSLFGEENVQVYGHLNAKTNGSIPFNTFFSAGKGKGFGVIKDFVRNLR